VKEQRFGQHSRHTLEAEMEEGFFVCKSTKIETMLTKIWTLMLPEQADV
jgi:hypothetical protein